MKQRIKIILGISFVVALVFYSLFTFWDYLEGPQIEIVFPDNGYSTTSSSIHIRGEVEHIDFLTLNDRQIFVDEKGMFEEVLLLNMGGSIIEIHGKDRYKREIKRVLQIVRISE